MPRNWKRILRGYLASLGSFLFYLPYAVYKTVSVGYSAARRRYKDAVNKFAGLLTHTFLWPFYSVYRFAAASAELAFGIVPPWYM
jgi:hypothetical protein